MTPLAVGTKYVASRDMHYTYVRACNDETVNRTIIDSASVWWKTFLAEISVEIADTVAISAWLMMLWVKSS